MEAEIRHWSVPDHSSRLMIFVHEPTATSDHAQEQEMQDLKHRTHLALLTSIKQYPPLLLQIAQK